MDFHTGIIAFSIVCGSISAVGTVWQFVIGQAPNAKSIIGRVFVIAVCSGAVAYLMLIPAKSSSRPAIVSADTHYQKAKQYFFQHERPLAEQEARQAILLKPTYEEAHKLLGACYGIDQNMDAAASEYKDATMIDPEDMEAELGLAMSLEAAGNKQEAKEAYRYVLRNPQSNPSEIQMARSRSRLLGNE